MEDDMKLPDGETCADCVHFTQCAIMYNAKAANVSCDFAPSRFYKATLTEKEDK